MSLPRPHCDIDLLYPAQNFQDLDQWLSTTSCEYFPIEAKRFSHKRAILYQQIMVEVFLLESQDGKYITNFFDGTYRAVAKSEPAKEEGSRARQRRGEFARWTGWKWYVEVIGLAFLDGIAWSQSPATSTHHTIPSCSVNQLNQGNQAEMGWPGCSARGSWRACKGACPLSLYGEQCSLANG